MKTALLLLAIFAGTACAQDVERNNKYKVGADTLTMRLAVFYPRSQAVSFINLHDDENTSVEAGMDFLSRYGGSLLQLKHSGKRIFNFRLADQRFSFDPNRIFTDTGLRATLEKYSTFDESAAMEVQKIRDTILANYVNDKKLVIALHNNTKTGLSALSYRKGGSEAANASRVYINPLLNPHDFLFTTDASIFRKLKQSRLNVVLQHQRPKDDGSLSVYAAKKKITYINVEALHGNLDTQIKMLEALKDIIFRY